MPDINILVVDDEKELSLIHIYTKMFGYLQSRGRE